MPQYRFRNLRNEFGEPFALQKNVDAFKDEIIAITDGITNEAVKKDVKEYRIDADGGVKVEKGKVFIAAYIDNELVIPSISSSEDEGLYLQFTDSGKNVNKSVKVITFTPIKTENNG